MKHPFSTYPFARDMRATTDKPPFLILRVVCLCNNPRPLGLPPCKGKSIVFGKPAYVCLSRGFALLYKPHSRLTYRVYLKITLAYSL